jgi:hypothetical protein
MHQFTLRMPRTLTMNASDGPIKFLLLLSVFVLQIGGKKLSGVHFRFPAVVVSKF